MATIWTPAGFANTERPSIEMPAAWLRAVADFAEDAGDLEWGIHCARCKQNVAGTNGIGDARWNLECGCRRYVGQNPFAAA